ncbi:DNA repair protein RecO [Candidatus Microgenomates bacterium]|nr:DNA repair protein RecO [Candidatus Microgenomates bacterium]
MRSYKTEGIILKRTNFGEADRILTVFTKKYGKVKIMAKGVRRITSRRSPNIELFNLTTLYIHKGRTFDILTEAQVINTFPTIRKNLELVGLAYYVCELVDGLCAEHQPHAKVFDLLVNVLQELDNGVIANFEQELLQELGFLPRRQLTTINTAAYIEQILERRLKTRHLLSKLS